MLGPLQLAQTTAVSRDKSPVRRVLELKAGVYRGGDAEVGNAVHASMRPRSAVTRAVLETKAEAGRRDLEALLFERGWPERSFY